ncbi:hypothetical protein DFP91_0151 [Pseudorhodoplanes sinuspersici]|nr:hypothetical protein DFP91_0151 [Pseudorhodoplanes sinuspersici]
MRASGVSPIFTKIPGHCAAPNTLSFAAHALTTHRSPWPAFLQLPKKVIAAPKAQPRQCRIPKMLAAEASVRRRQPGHLSRPGPLTPPVMREQFREFQSSRKIRLSRTGIGNRRNSRDGERDARPRIQTKPGQSNGLRIEHTAICRRWRDSQTVSRSLYFLPWFLDCLWQRC